MQRCYLDGLAEDESVPFGWQEHTGEVTPGMNGPQIRENVDAGTDVIDLTAMRAELEADRARRGGG
jgi:hypothetical protein